MNRDHDRIDRERRGFVKNAAAAGVAGVLASAVPPAAVADNRKEAEPGQEQKGYRLTQHVLDYYKSATR